MIRRALRAQALSFVGDVVLLGVAAAAFVMALTLATSIPPQIADAPAGMRDELTAPFGAVIATYGAVLAAVYGSFRYTIDRRDGVIAQRLTMQPRRAVFLARIPASAVGGALVALAGVVGGHTALMVTLGGVPMEWSVVGSTLALGAVAGLWGMGIGVVVQAHLVALFVASLSLGAAMLVALFWKGGAVYLPLLAMLAALRFDLTAVGIMPKDSLDSTLAVLVAAGWTLAALLTGGAVFMNRDVK
ncbi:hypothetical protein [Microbacterium sp. MYb62]|uniref:hypothetical protein n=1 Tax=Microbacterium sp. MYb62 TaxID=1848690 RepID=UPI000CFC3848|nr:hypothetical protein [Microbacterium sp. MYb62]PRB11787.1 hypothetical protein CQ042_16165 [Microbacterium sp. MYb62]